MSDRQTRGRKKKKRKRDFQEKKGEREKKVGKGRKWWHLEGKKRERNGSPVPRRTNEKKKEDWRGRGREKMDAQSNQRKVRRGGQVLGCSPNDRSTGNKKKRR